MAAYLINDPSAACHDILCRPAQRAPSKNERDEGFFRPRSLHPSSIMPSAAPLVTAGVRGLRRLRPADVVERARVNHVEALDGFAATRMTCSREAVSGERVSVTGW